jgi:hypothetical protein
MLRYQVLTTGTNHRKVRCFHTRTDHCSSAARAATAGLGPRLPLLSSSRHLRRCWKQKQKQIQQPNVVIDSTNKQTNKQTTLFTLKSSEHSIGGVLISPALLTPQTNNQPNQM